MLLFSLTEILETYFNIDNNAHIADILNLKYQNHLKIIDNNMSLTVRINKSENSDKKGRKVSGEGNSILHTPITPTSIPIPNNLFLIL